MVAGLPGTGIGGLFYLLMAFWMPVHALSRLLRGLPPRRPWSVILRQSGFAAAIVSGIWATGWAVTRVLLSLDAYLPDCLRLSKTMPQGDDANMMILISIAASFGTLTVVTLGVHLLRYAVRRGNQIQNGHRPAAAWAPSAEPVLVEIPVVNK
jgi:hypothetical protein